MGKDAKVKGKTSTKKVKGRKRTAEKQELTDSLRNTLISTRLLWIFSRCRDCRRHLPNQEPLLLSARIFFFSLTKWSYWQYLFQSSLGQFFSFSLPSKNFFSVFDISIRVRVCFHVGIFSSTVHDVNKNMHWITSNEHFPWKLRQRSRPLTRLWQFPGL